ncbi:MAG: NUDIX hydrolase [Nostocoides sp.]
MTPVSQPPWLEGIGGSVARSAYFQTLPPVPATPRSSAVLMLFGPTAQTETDPVQRRSPDLAHTDVVLTRRAAGLRSHPGQISFPGGQIDRDDAHPVAAALREAREEIDLRPDGVVVVADLPRLFLPPSQNVVTPIVGWWPSPHPVRVVDPGEVADVARIRLADLVNPDNRFMVVTRQGFRGPAAEVDGWFIWGFTAMLLFGVLDAAGMTLPFDQSRVRPIPAEVGPSPFVPLGGDREQPRAPGREMGGQ